MEGVDRSTVQHRERSDKAGLTMPFPTPYMCIFVQVQSVTCHDSCPRPNAVIVALGQLARVVWED